MYKLGYMNANYTCNKLKLGGKRMSREVCTCLGISEDDIKKAIKDGATTVEAVEEATGAGSVCGGCKDDIQDIIDKNK